MRIIRSIEEIESPLENAVVTIGNFDGVHLGHQALLHTVNEHADAFGGTSTAITFEPHPTRVLKRNGHPPLITLIEQKSELIARAGIAVLIIIPFSKQFAEINPRRFVAEILVRRIGMRALVVGRDYTFGKDRRGSLEVLRQWAPELGYEVIVVDWIQSMRGSTNRISSTRIRQLVMEGDMQAAKRLLGRDYQIRGKVDKGKNRGGRLLGFPTANINLQDELSPREGIYAVVVEHGDRVLKGVANIGYSPTFDDHQFTVEVHIIDFEDDIYGDAIRINFIKRLRDEIKFESIHALAAQIRCDVIEARRLLAAIAT